LLTYYLFIVYSITILICIIGCGVAVDERQFRKKPSAAGLISESFVGLSQVFRCFILGWLFLIDAARRMSFSDGKILVAYTERPGRVARAP
jgi:hypothetical protein